MKKTKRTKAAPKEGAVPPTEDGAFWQCKSAEQLAAEQGIGPVQDFDALFGAGKELWKDDADFEVFLEGLRESRRTGG
jgi:hypothetical protein